MEHFEGRPKWAAQCQWGISRDGFLAHTGESEQEFPGEEEGKGHSRLWGGGGGGEVFSLQESAQKSQLHLWSSQFLRDMVGLKYKMENVWFSKMEKHLSIITFSNFVKNV